MEAVPPVRTPTPATVKRKREVSIRGPRPQQMSAVFRRPPVCPGKAERLLSKGQAELM